MRGRATPGARVGLRRARDGGEGGGRCGYARPAAREFSFAAISLAAPPHSACRYLTEHIWLTIDGAQRRSGRLIKLVRVIDARDMSLRHVSMKFFGAVAAAARGGAEDAYPQMIGGFFLCNAGGPMKFFFEHTIRPLLPTRLVEKSAFYEPLRSPADLEALLGWLPMERLPTLVGGAHELYARPHATDRA